MVTLQRPAVRASVVAIMLGLAVLLALAGPGRADSVDDRATVEWMRRHAAPFDTCAFRADHGDLASLPALIGDARIVGLGEGTHGTREFFQMKHRIVEYLVTEMGFRYFAIEANMPEAYRLNDYVLHGVGDPRALIRGMHYFTWRTQEVLALVEWMRHTNASGHRHIEFLGFDMGFPDTSLAIVRRFCIQADPSWTDTVSTLARGMAADAGMRSSIGSRTLNAMAARRLYAHLRAARERLARATNPKDADWAIQNARIAEQCARNRLDFFVRDSAMANNVEWILGHAPPGAKVILWAHNSHVSRTPGYMGDFLARRFGSAYRPIGFATGSGTYRAVFHRKMTQDLPLQAPPGGSLESLCRAVGPARFVLDLRGGTLVPIVKRTLGRGILMRHIGALAMDEQFQPIALLSAFDGLIWIEHTSSALEMSNGPSPK